MPAGSTDRPAAAPPARPARAAVLLLSPLLLMALWRLTYPYTCLAHGCPLLCAALIGQSRYRAAVHKRAFLAGYYFRPGTLLHRLVASRLAAALWAGSLGLVSAYALALFVAPATSGDALLIGLAWLAALCLLPLVAAGLAPSVQPGLQRLLAARLSGALAFGLTAACFVALALHSPVPDYIDPGSLARTIDNASRSLHSLCPVTQAALQLSEGWTAASWFYVVRGSALLASDALQLAGWLAFLLQASLALLGMVWLSTAAGVLAWSAWQPEER